MWPGADLGPRPPGPKPGAWLFFSYYLGMFLNWARGLAQLTARAQPNTLTQASSRTPTRSIHPNRRPSEAASSRQQPRRQVSPPPPPAPSPAAPRPPASARPPTAAHASPRRGVARPAVPRWRLAPGGLLLACSRPAPCCLAGPAAVLLLRCSPAARLACSASASPGFWSEVCWIGNGLADVEC